jgi:hypothetical protein
MAHFAAEAAVRAPAGFEGRGPGKVLDPNLLPVEIWSPEIKAAAREHGLVFEATPASLPRMKPGVEHNFVIVEKPGGLIEMTVGRLAPGNVKEVGVKHVALGDGRAVLYSGSARLDPATGRPVLDFNSGMYSQVGLDRRWAPTPENARALAAHAEAILKTLRAGGRPKPGPQSSRKTCEPQGGLTTLTDRYGAQAKAKPDGASGGT